MQQPLFDVERHLMNHPWRDFAHPAYMQQTLFDVERHLMNHPWRDFAHPAREFFQLLGRQVLGPGLP
jgi:hypothetical protein